MFIRTIELSFNNKEEAFILPINPIEFEFSEANLNQTINILDIGEINLIGHRGLVSCRLSSFFPSSSSPHYSRADRSPIDYINLLKKWKESGKPIRIIISDSYINLAMAIQNIIFIQKEGDLDIYYDLELLEYRFLNIASSDLNSNSSITEENGLKSRLDDREQPTTYTVKENDTLWGISSRIYGSGSKYQDIYNANSNIIKDPNLIYVGQELVIP